MTENIEQVMQNHWIPSLVGISFAEHAFMMVARKVNQNQSILAEGKRIEVPLQVSPNI